MAINNSFDSYKPMDSFDTTQFSDSVVTKTLPDHFIELLKKSGFDEQALPSLEEISYFEDVPELKLFYEWFTSCISDQNIVTCEELNSVQDDSLILRDADQLLDEELESLLGHPSELELCPTDEDVANLEERNSVLNKQSIHVNTLVDGVKSELRWLQERTGFLKNSIQESKKSTFKEEDTLSNIKSQLNIILQNLSDHLKIIISHYESDNSAMVQASSHIQLPMENYTQLSSSVQRSLQSYFMKINEVLEEDEKNYLAVRNLAMESFRCLNTLEMDKLSLEYKQSYLEKLCKTIEEIEDIKLILSSSLEAKESVQKSCLEIEVIPSFDTSVVQLEVEKFVEHYLYHQLHPYYCDLETRAEMLVDQSILVNKLAFGWQNCDKIIVRALNSDIRRGKLTDELFKITIPQIKQALTLLSEGFKSPEKRKEHDWKGALLSCKPFLIRETSKKSIILDDLVEPLKDLATRQQTTVAEIEQIISTLPLQIKKILRDLKKVKKVCWDTMSFRFDGGFSKIVDNLDLQRARLLRLRDQQNANPKSIQHYKNVMALSLTQPSLFINEIQKIEEEKCIRKAKLENSLKKMQPSFLD